MLAYVLVINLLESVLIGCVRVTNLLESVLIGCVRVTNLLESVLIGWPDIAADRSVLHLEADFLTVLSCNRNQVQ